MLLLRLPDLEMSPPPVPSDNLAAAPLIFNSSPGDPFFPPCILSFADSSKCIPLPDPFAGRAWGTPVVSSGSQRGSPPCSSQHPALYPRDILKAPRFSPRSSPNEFFPVRSGMETASRVDQHPRAEYHGCGERPAAYAGSRKPRTDDAAAIGAEERGGEGNTYVCTPCFSSSLHVFTTARFAENATRWKRSLPNFECLHRVWPPRP